MAEIVNLRRARKAKVRRAAESEAETNRAKFGRTKAEKAGKILEEKRAEKHLDQSRLDPHKG
jgi:hypothetical protein